jgi:hypothetical protein
MHQFESTAPPFDHVLPYFRAVMPGATGVVLSTARGEPLAHDLDGEVRGLTEAAVRLHYEACGCAPLDDLAHGSSILVPHRGGVVLVVFLPPQVAVPPSTMGVTPPLAA